MSNQLLVDAVRESVNNRAKNVHENSLMNPSVAEKFQEVRYISVGSPLASRGCALIDDDFVRRFTVVAETVQKEEVPHLHEIDHLAGRLLRCLEAELGSQPTVRIGRIPVLDTLCDTNWRASSYASAFFYIIALLVKLTESSDVSKSDETSHSGGEAAAMGDGGGGGGGKSAKKVGAGKAKSDTDQQHLKVKQNLRRILNSQMYQFNVVCDKWRTLAFSLEWASNLFPRLTFDNNTPE